MGKRRFLHHILKAVGSGDDAITTLPKRDGMALELYPNPDVDQSTATGSGLIGRVDHLRRTLSEHLHLRRHKQVSNDCNIRSVSCPGVAKLGRGCNRDRSSSLRVERYVKDAMKHCVG